MSNINDKNLVGLAFEEMSIEEMAASQGSGDVGAETSAACVISVTASSAWCGVSAIIGASVVYSVKHC